MYTLVWYKQIAIENTLNYPLRSIHLLIILYKKSIRIKPSCEITIIFGIEGCQMMVVSETSVRKYLIVI